MTQLTARTSRLFLLLAISVAAPALAQAPDVFILTAPSGEVYETKATITFNSYQANVTFECKLDQRTLEFEPCTSPVTYTILSSGPHTFTVRARDAQGNVDPTPATHTWTVLARNGCTTSPAGLSLMAVGLAGLWLMRRKR